MTRAPCPRKKEACFDFAPMIFIFATRPKSEAQNRIRIIISLRCLIPHDIMIQHYVWYVWHVVWYPRSKYLRYVRSLPKMSFAEILDLSHSWLFFFKYIFLHFFFIFYKKVEKRQLWVRRFEWLKLNFASCVVHQTRLYNKVFVN